MNNLLDLVLLRNLGILCTDMLEGGNKELKVLTRPPNSSRSQYDQASVGCARASLIHGASIPQQKGPRGSTAIAPVPDTTQRP